VSTDELFQNVRCVLLTPFSAVFLFGSYARGDQDAESDIDVLQVTPTRAKSYTRGKINVTCYTRDQLLSMANSGSLFVRHIILEGMAIIDPDNLLQTLKNTFIEPPDNADLRRGVCCALPLIAIREPEFADNPHHYSATAGYLLRTYVYADAFKRGIHSFSLREIAWHTGDDRAHQSLIQLRANETFTNFQEVVELLFKKAGVQPFYRLEPLEAFLVNIYGNCELALILGLRILARGDLIAYAFLGPTG
jgi:hypothetical protein